MCVCLCVCVRVRAIVCARVCVDVSVEVHFTLVNGSYGEALVSRIDKVIGLYCKRAL